MKSGISPQQWHNLINVYLTEQKRLYPKMNINDEKGNLVKALLKNDIPWQRLCQGMTIVSPEGFTFTFTAKLGDIEFEKVITVQPTYKEPRGEIFYDLWNELIVTYEDRFNDWKALCEVAAEKYCFGKCKANNLKTSLKSSQVTWRSFYDGLRVMDFDSCTVSLSTNKHSVSLNIK